MQDNRSIIQNFKNTVDTVFNFKLEKYGKGPDIFNNAVKQARKLEAQLRERGCHEDTHPEFRDQVIRLNRWSNEKQLS